MEKTTIIEALARWNFWKKDVDTGFKRDYTDSVFNALKYDKVLTLIGIRRAGKSYILRQVAKKLIDDGIPRENILIANFEEPAFEGIDLQELLKIYDSYKEIIQPEGKPYVFLDEVQEVKKWEKFVRSLNETKEANIIITGSSSKMLSDELATVLTGRQLNFEIWPLSFEEFLKFRGIGIETEKDIALNSGEIKKMIYEYVENGGFPEVVLADNSEIKMKIIADYYDTILNRDIINRYKIREIEKIKALLKYYVTNIASQITYRKISKFLHMPTETISRFSVHFQSAKIIFFVPKFSFSLKEQDNSPRKVYCADNGFFNATGFRFMENKGKLIENSVSVELKRQNKETYYWKDDQQREVDFVVKEGAHIRQLIQVCYDIGNFNTKEREINALLKASEELDCQNLLVITWDYEPEEKIKNKKIVYKPLWKWLLTGNNGI